MVIYRLTSVGLARASSPSGGGDGMRVLYWMRRNKNAGSGEQITDLLFQGDKMSARMTMNHLIRDRAVVCVNA